MKDLSTRRLKRYYWKTLRELWYYQSLVGDRFPLSTATYISKLRGNAANAKKELEHRGLWLP